MGNVTNETWQEALLMSGIGKPIPSDQRMRDLWESGRVPSLSGSEVLGILAYYGVIPRNCSIRKDYGSDTIVDSFEIKNNANQNIIVGYYHVRQDALQYKVANGDNSYVIVKRPIGCWTIVTTENY